MITEKIKEIIDKMKAIQVHILNYLDNEEDTEQNFQKHINILDDHQIHDNRSYLQLFINLIKNIADNHRRTPSFFIKIEKIVTIYKDDINKHFTKSELLNIFKKSKRLLLLLIKMQIIPAYRDFYDTISTYFFYRCKYHHYFRKEILPFVDHKLRKLMQYHEDFDYYLESEIPDDYEKNREIGEAEDYVCELIRKDSIAEFVKFHVENELQYDYFIYPSVYETNMSLVDVKSGPDENIPVIEYAAFYGATKIFNYLFKYAEKYPSLWIRAVHSRNLNIIRKLEEEKVDSIYEKSGNKPFLNCIEESIKCHHNEFVYFFMNNFIDYKIDPYFILELALKYYNFELMDSELFNQSSFVNLCKYNYLIFVDLLLKDKDIDVNAYAI